MSPPKSASVAIVVFDVVLFVDVFADEKNDIFLSPYRVNEVTGLTLNSAIYF